MYASDPLYDIRRTLSITHSLQHLLPPIGERNAKKLGKKTLSCLDVYATTTQVPPSVLQYNLHPLFQNKAQHGNGKTSLYGKFKFKSTTPTSVAEESNEDRQNGREESTSDGVIPTSTSIPRENELWVPINASIDHFLVPLSPPRASNEHDICRVETEVDPWDTIPLVDRSNHTRSLSADSDQSYCDFWCQSPSPSFQSFRKRSSSVIEEYEPCIPLPKDDLETTSNSLNPRSIVRIKSPSPHFDNSEHHEEYTDSNIPTMNVRKQDSNVIDENKPASPTRRSRPLSPQIDQCSLSQDDDDNASGDISQVDASSSDVLEAPLDENRREDRTINKVIADIERLRLSSMKPLDNALVTPTSLYLGNTFTKGQELGIENNFIIETANKLSWPASNSYSNEAERNTSVKAAAIALTVGVDAGEHSENEKAGSLFSDDDNDESQHLLVCSQPNPNPNPEPSSSNNRQYISPPPSPKVPTASLPSPPASECGASPRLDSNASFSLPLPPPLTLNSSSLGPPAKARNYIQTSHKKSKKGSAKPQRKSTNLFLPSSRTTAIASGSKPREENSSSSSIRSLLRLKRGPAPVKEERIREVKLERNRVRGYAKPQNEVKNEKTMTVLKEEKIPAKKEKTEKATTVKEEKKPAKEEKSEKIERKKRKLIGSERRAAAEASHPRKRLKLQPTIVDKVMVARWVAGIRLQLTLSEAKTLHRVNGELLLKHLNEIDERKDKITRELWLYPPGKDNLDVFLQMLSENGPTAYEEVWPDLGVMEKADSLRKYVIQQESRRRRGG